MVLSSESIKFDGKDVECIFEPGNGEVWTLWFNSFEVFMVTATKGGQEFHRDIFEDLDALMTECQFDNRVRRLVACSSVFIQPYVLGKDIILH